ncbi:MAG: M23 family metallopeptidase [Bacteroidota bacterium]|nr:M23 family metallopeptidase [Bacteroidota bacterium]
MAKKNNKKKPSTKVFRLLVLDDASLNQISSYRFSKTGITLGVISVLIILAVLMSILFIYTPLNFLFPSRSNINLQRQIIQNSIVIDSLSASLEQEQNYVKQIKYIIQGKIPEDTTEEIATLYDSSISKKKLDFSTSYLDSVMQEQITNVENKTFAKIKSNASQKGNVKNLHFITPLKGSISRKFNSNDGHYAVDITPGTDNAVLATLSGTVIFTEWSLKTGHVIAIQHDNNIVSFYKHNSSVLKKTGDRVAAGESIAIAGNSGENTTGTHLHFELWKNGTPVNPEDYISF